MAPPSSQYTGAEDSRWQRAKLAVNGVFLVLLLGSIIPVLWLTRQDHQATAGKVHLRFMYWGGPEQLEQEYEVRDAFQAELKKEGREDVEVEFIGASSRYDTKLKAMMSAHEAPDVFMVSPPSICKFADRESPQIVDITDLVAAERKAEAPMPKEQRQLDFDDLLPQAVQTFYCNGRLWGFPRDYKSTGMGYNADMLAGLGLEDPNDLYARDEWTWEKLREYLARLNTLKDAKGKPVFGLWQDSYFEGYWGNILFQAGGGVWSDDSRELIIDCPESIAGLQWVHDLAWKDKVAWPWSAELGAANPWVNQQAGMLGLRGWHVTSYIRQTFVTDGGRQDYDPEKVVDANGQTLGWRLRDGPVVPPAAVQWISGREGRGPFQPTDYFSFAWDACPWPLGPQQDYDPEPVRRGDKAVGWKLTSGRVVLPEAVVWQNQGQHPGKGPFRLRQCGATGIGYCMSVDGKAENRPMAWRLLKFLVGPEAQKIRASFQLKLKSGRKVTIAGINMPSRRSLEGFYLDMARRTPRPVFTGCLAKKNQQAIWPRIDAFLNGRHYGRPSTGSLVNAEVDRYLDRQFQRMLDDPAVTPQEVAEKVRARADEIFERQRRDFPSSFNAPELVRPADQDPLGLAPQRRWIEEPPWLKK